MELGRSHSQCLRKKLGNIRIPKLVFFSRWYWSYQMELKHIYSTVYVLFWNCISVSSSQKRQGRKEPNNDVYFLCARRGKRTESWKFRIDCREKFHDPPCITFSIKTSIVCTEAYHSKIIPSHMMLNRF